MDGERVVTPSPDERGREIVNALIATAEAELLRGDAETRERLSWVAYALLRRSPVTLWKILKAQDEPSMVSNRVLLRYSSNAALYPAAAGQ